MTSSVLADCSTESLHKYELNSWAKRCQFQSICCRRDRGVSTAHLTRSAGLRIILLLLLSGNIHPNPSPELIGLLNPDDQKNSGGLRFIHVNAWLIKLTLFVYGLKLQKVTYLSCLRHSSNHQLLTIWFTSMGIFSLGRIVWIKEGVAIHVKGLDCCSVEIIKKPKFFEMCAIKVNLPNGATLMW